jgi:hypothetical protein
VIWWVEVVHIGVPFVLGVVVGLYCRKEVMIRYVCDGCSATYPSRQEAEVCRASHGASA